MGDAARIDAGGNAVTTCVASPCGTLAIVRCCPLCGGEHVHGWSGDPEFDRRTRRIACVPATVRTPPRYALRMVAVDA